MEFIPKDIPKQTVKPKFLNAKCNECPYKLNASAKSVKLGNDSDKVDLVIVGEAPGLQEVIQEEAFVGDSGQLLRNSLPEDHTYYLTNVVMCRPPQNQVPEPKAIECCTPRLEAELNSINCDNILVVGDTAKGAISSIYDVILPSGKVSVLRGTSVKSNPTLLRQNEVKISFAFHPAYILRNPGLKDQFENDLKLALGEGTARDIQSLIPDIKVLDNLFDLTEALDNIPPNEIVSFDIETRNLQWFDSSRPKDEILCLGLATSKQIYIIPFPLGRQAQQILFDNLKEFRLVGHNSKFDIIFLKQAGIEVECWFDTLLAHHELYEEQPHGLKTLAFEYFGIKDYEDELILPYVGKNQYLKDYSKVPSEILYKYLALDLWVTLNLQPIFLDKILSEELGDHFFNLIMKSNITATEMQYTGFKLDAVHLDTVAEELDARSEILTKELTAIAGVPSLNPNSSQQVGAILYGKLNLPKIKYTHKTAKGWETSFTSTSQAVLDQLNHPFVDKLTELRKVKKMRSSYTDTILQWVDINSRVHGDILLFGTETGRMSIHDPALQTIPRSDDVEGEFDYGGLIKSSFVAEDGWLLVIADYSQAELRIAAALSGDSFLLDTYNNNRDLHSEVAAIITSHAQYTKYDRFLAKKINFGIAYYAGAGILAQQTKVNYAVAQMLIDKAMGRMTGFREWREKQLQFAIKNNFVQTRLGRKRHVPIITGGNLHDIKKIVVNSPIQGGAGELTLYALNMIRARFKSEGLRSRLVLSVHDSIIAEAPKEEANYTGEIIKFEMEDAGERWYPEVKWKADLDEPTERWAKVPVRHENQS